MRITFVNGIRSGEELEFSVPEITIGRETDNLLELPVDGVSRHHAILVRKTDKHWYVADLGSTNGVKVNGLPLRGERQLKEGDLIAFGEEIMQVSNFSDAGKKIVFSELGGEPEPEPRPEIPRHESTVSAAAPTVLLDNIPEMTQEEAAEFQKTASSLDFFRRKKSTAPGAAAEPPRKKILNGVFYLAIALIVISALFLFKKTQTAESASQTAVERPKIFALHYVKEIISRDNIFRFEMTVENRNVWFVIDDVRSDRKYESQKKILPEATFLSLRNVIEDSGVLKMIQPERGGISSAGSTRLFLQIIDGSEEKTVEVFNTSPPRSFLTVEEELTAVASEYGLQSISLTPEEILAQAEQSFERGRDLLNNWQSRQANLREAIRYLSLAVEYLEQFTPKPKMWKNAQELLAQAKKIRSSEMKRLNAEYLRALQMKDYVRQKELLLKIRDTSEENSDNFRKANDKLMKVDAILRKGGRRK